MIAAEDLSRVVAGRKGKQPANGRSKSKVKSKKQHPASPESDTDDSATESEEVKKCKDDGDLKYYKTR